MTTIQRNVQAPADGGAKPTRRQNAEKGFTASKELTENLQRVHVDLIELHLQGKQAHWNVVGKNFRDLHLQLDEIVEEVREFSDTVAERLRALHAVPDGRSDTVAERLRALHAVPDGRSDTVAAGTSLPEYPNGEIDTATTVDLITQRLEATVGTMREVHDEVDDEDPTSADILHGIIERLEQFAWMVSAENRKPATGGASSKKA
jgi:starvation-inducible DNA-binding protein